VRERERDRSHGHNDEPDTIGEVLQRARLGGALKHHEHVAVEHDLHHENPDHCRQRRRHGALQQETVVQQPASHVHPSDVCVCVCVCVCVHLHMIRFMFTQQTRQRDTDRGTGAHTHTDRDGDGDRDRHTHT